jgi:hypothetical protein
METGDQLRWHMSALSSKHTRWRQLKRRRDWPPETEQVLVTIQDGGKRFVVAGYWIDELDNWSFLEYWVSAKAIAWRPLPEPFAGGVLGYN